MSKMTNRGRSCDVNPPRIDPRSETTECAAKKLKMTRVARGNTDISKTNSRRPLLAQPTNQAAACGTSRVASS